VFSDILNNIKMALVAIDKQLVNVFSDILNNIKIMVTNAHECSPQQALRTVRQIKVLH
jgi:hypothetical protein